MNKKPKLIQKTSYICKQVLGDFGVRKFDDLTGRFTAIDPLWEKFYAWNPYMYSANNPINAVDLDGRDIIVLLDKEGADDLGVEFGHSAVLIGNDKVGWQLYSKNGGTLGLFGSSEKPDLGENKAKFKTLDDFYKAKDDKKTGFQIERYDVGFRISSNEEEDNKMKAEAKKQAKESYNIFNNSCNHTQCRTLDLIGVQPGRSSIPNVSFQQLILWNMNLNNGRTYEKINIIEERERLNETK